MKHLSTIMSAVALAVALTMGGAYAAGIQITGKQIKNNSVKPRDVKFPAAHRVGAAGARAASARAQASVAEDFALVADLGSTTKIDPSSVLQITWTGTATASGFSPCIFQLRLDDQPPPGGGGEAYVGNGGQTVSISDQALFPADPGPHQVAVYARAANGVESPCIVGGGIEQTINAAELVQ